MQQHLVLQPVVGDPLQVGFAGRIELPGHDQPAALRAAAPLELRPGVEQQVQTLVVADQAEEEHIAQRRVEAQAGAGLGTRYALTEVLEEGMRREERRSPGVGLQLAVDLLGHVDEAIDRAQEVAVEDPVGQVVFVRLDVVDLAEHLRMAVSARQTSDGAEAGGHEGGPVLQQHEVGPVAADLPPDPPPVERIDRMDAAGDVQIGRRRVVTVWLFPGKSSDGYCSVKVRIRTSSPRRWNVRAMISMIEARPPR